MPFQVDDDKAGTPSKPQIVQGTNKIYPACLPRVDDRYNSARLWVAGWGLTKQRILRDVNHNFCLAFFLLNFAFFKGNQTASERITKYTKTCGCTCANL